MITVYQTNTQNCAKLNRNQHIEWKTKIIDTPVLAKTQFPMISATTTAASGKMNNRWNETRMQERNMRHNK